MTSSAVAPIRQEDIGLDLCVLAHHLFQRYSQGKAALRELCLRCQCPLSTADLASCTSAGRLSLTQWYTSMKQRFAAVTKQVRETRKADLVETEDLVRSLYPSGCSLSEYADVVQTCAAMLPFTIPGETVTRFIDHEGTRLSELKCHSLSLDELYQGLVDRLIVPSLVPVRWWANNAASASLPYQATRVGLAVSPLRITIEYRETESGKTCSRVISLQNHLPLNGPTGNIARRLASVHGSIVNEDTLQRLLVLLQRLAQTNHEPQQTAQPTPSSAAASPQATQSAQASESMPSSSSSAPQKADLGLLYRDPEKALQNVDLNDADDMTVKEFKEAMNVGFASNAVRPGDSGYMYDKRVEFKPTAKSEWDDDDSD